MAVVLQFPRRMIHLHREIRRDEGLSFALIDDEEVVPPRWPRDYREDNREERGYSFPLYLFLVGPVFYGTVVLLVLHWKGYL